MNVKTYNFDIEGNTVPVNIQYPDWMLKTVTNFALVKAGKISDYQDYSHGWQAEGIDGGVPLSTLDPKTRIVLKKV